MNHKNRRKDEARQWAKVQSNNDTIFERLLKRQLNRVGDKKWSNKEHIYLLFQMLPFTIKTEMISELRDYAIYKPEYSVHGDKWYYKLNGIDFNAFHCKMIEKLRERFS